MAVFWLPFGSVEQSPADEDIDYDIVWVQLLSFRELG